MLVVNESGVDDRGIHKPYASLGQRHSSRCLGDGLTGLELSFGKSERFDPVVVGRSAGLGLQVALVFRIHQCNADSVSEAAA